MSCIVGTHGYLILQGRAPQTAQLVQDASRPIDIAFTDFQARARALSLPDAVRKQLPWPDAGGPDAPEGVARKTIAHQQYVTATCQPALPAVIELGRQMIRSQPFPSPGAPRIPVAYTYLGQFIAHELSKPSEEEADGSITWRSAAFALDSLFWEPPGRSTRTFPPGTCPAHGVAIGQTSARGPGDWQDLPRHADGHADIPEHRNDLNVAVAQTHVLLSKFHQTVASRLKITGKDAYRVTLDHVHAVLLHDYLPRVVDPDVYRDVMTHGRSIVHPGGVSHPFFLPAEFALACFRFGHSMVRDRYPDWRRRQDQPSGAPGRHAIPGQLFDHTEPGGELIAGRLDDDWRNRWSNLLRVRQDDPRDPMTTRIDGEVDVALAQLPDFQLPSGKIPDLPPRDRTNLSGRTLVRGLGLGLASGQDCARYVLDNQRKGAPVFPVLSQDDILAASGDAVRLFLDGTAHQAQTLNGCTPLWYYALCEATVAQGGRTLGPMASRFVTETIHAAIEAAGSSLVQRGKTRPFTPRPDLCTRPTEQFELRDVIACVDAFWTKQDTV